MLAINLNEKRKPDVKTRNYNFKCFNNRWPVSAICCTNRKYN